MTVIAARNASPQTSQLLAPPQLYTVPTEQLPSPPGWATVPHFRGTQPQKESVIMTHASLHHGPQGHSCTEHQGLCLICLTSYETKDLTLRRCTCLASMPLDAFDGSYAERSAGAVPRLAGIAADHSLLRVSCECYSWPALLGALSPIRQVAAVLQACVGAAAKPSSKPVDADLTVIVLHSKQKFR